MTHKLCPNCAHSVSFEHVSVENDGVTILTDISASIPRGGCTAIVGPNGAGKTTLVLTLLDEIPYSGTIRFHGYDSERPRFGYVPQSLSFDRGMPLTVLEFMAAFHQKRPLCFGIRKSLKTELLALLEKTGCAQLADRPLGALSGGELQRVMLSGALSQDPELLILDEPTEGIQPSIIKDLARQINDLKLSKDLAIVVSEQVLSFTIDIADKMYVIESGRFVREDTRGNFDVEKITSYLSV